MSGLIICDDCTMPEGCEFDGLCAREQDRINTEREEGVVPEGKQPINHQPADIHVELTSLLAAMGFNDYAAIRKLEITPREAVVYVAQRNDSGEKMLAADYGLLLSEHRLAVIT